MIPNGRSSMIDTATRPTEEAEHHDRDPRHRPDRGARRNGLRRMPGRRRVVVPPAPLRPVRAHRLLRQLTRAARQRPFATVGSPADPELRTGRGLVLELPGWAVLQRPGPVPAAQPPGRPAGAGPGRARARRLAQPAAL